MTTAFKFNNSIIVTTCVMRAWNELGRVQIPETPNCRASFGISKSSILYVGLYVGSLNGGGSKPRVCLWVKGGSRYVEGCWGFPYSKSFLVSWFLVSWFLGFKVSKLQRFTKIPSHAFRNILVPYPRCWIIY